MNLNIDSSKKLVSTIVKETTSLKECTKKGEEVINAVENRGCEAISSYAKAGLNIKNSTENLFDVLQHFAKTNFLEEGEHIDRLITSKQGNVVRMRAGKEIQGFKGLYSDDKRICGYLGEGGSFEKVFVKNNKTEEVDVFNVLTGETIHYSKDDMAALRYYKYHPDAIHSKLRHDRDIYSGSFKDEMNESVEHLRNIFNDKSKVEKSNKKITLYRALQSDLTKEELENLSEIGNVFTEKSFCSTTTNLKDAQRFSKGKNPIIEIEASEETEFLDMDKLFNIDREHWSEHEYLLNEKSSFQVIGFDNEKNIIKVKLLK